MERKRGVKEFSNGLATMCNRNYTADGLTAENLIPKDPSADLPVPSKFVNRCQLKCCT